MSTETNRFAAPLTPGQILFSFQGRIPRKTYWIWGVGALLLVAIFFFILLGILGVKDQTTTYLVNALLLWPSLAITVKRWHDRDKSAWWLLIVLVPIIGALWAFIECGFLRGTTGPNRFGEDLTGKV
ncbi:DUF805 domain-containing protein [Rivibacter subsaxonicus]|uniref:Uncharacterized membrane protein YhaH (DUF805 family) n=1 Tax=Rivibacter subsaxonicus TaxID=457575 RepID=A0A4Q7W096_9BURK|nr:DUF805 domain-containing protein [Rivibacter subsaxonicus]RZU02288.1 uncharacterized membrane protein YhaH (DUF805 family) [Rivibacter subsaxonicus]